MTVSSACTQCMCKLSAWSEDPENETESNTLESMWKLMSAVMSLYAGCANSRQNVAEILISLHVLYLTRWKEWEINLFRQNLLVFFASGTGIEASIFNGGGKAYRWISVKDFFLRLYTLCLITSQVFAKVESS